MRATSQGRLSPDILGWRVAHKIYPMNARSVQTNSKDRNPIDELLILQAWILAIEIRYSRARHHKPNLPYFNFIIKSLLQKLLL
jgi:hypothetical protein